MKLFLATVLLSSILASGYAQSSSLVKEQLSGYKSFSVPAKGCEEVKYKYRGNTYRVYPCDADEGTATI